MKWESFLAIVPYNSYKIDVAKSSMNLFRIVYRKLSILKILLELFICDFQVMNVGTSVAKVGFFGEMNQRLWCLTHIETLRLYFLRLVQVYLIDFYNLGIISSQIIWHMFYAIFLCKSQVHWNKFITASKLTQLKKTFSLALVLLSH